MLVDLSTPSDCHMPLPSKGRDHGESGQGLVEYAILAALISTIALFLVIAIGADIPQLFAIPLNAL